MIAIHGAARISMTNYGLVTLYSSSEALIIDATFGRRFTFAPEDVWRLEPFTWIPILGWGIRIHHKCADIPRGVAFMSIWPPRWVLQDIARGGFMAKGEQPGTSAETSPDRPDREAGGRDEGEASAPSKHP